MKEAQTATTSGDDGIMTERHTTSKCRSVMGERTTISKRRSVQPSTRHTMHTSSSARARWHSAFALVRKIQKAPTSVVVGQFSPAGPILQELKLAADEGAKL